MLRRAIQASVASIGLVSVLCVVVAGVHSSNVAAAGRILLRPPYNSTYRLTSFFDHNYPNYGNDNEITIYTGESVADCSPHCYEGHPGYDWSMAEGTEVRAAYSLTAGGCQHGSLSAPQYTTYPTNFWIDNVSLRRGADEYAVTAYHRPRNRPLEPKHPIARGALCFASMPAAAGVLALECGAAPAPCRSLAVYLILRYD